MKNANRKKDLLHCERMATSIQWEVNTAGSVAGEQVRIVRIESQELMKLDELGMNPDQLEQLKCHCEMSKADWSLCPGPKKAA